MENYLGYILSFIKEMIIAIFHWFFLDMPGQKKSSDEYSTNNHQAHKEYDKISDSFDWGLFYTLFAFLFLAIVVAALIIY